MVEIRKSWTATIGTRSLWNLSIQSSLWAIEISIPFLINAEKGSIFFHFKDGLFSAGELIWKCLIRIVHSICLPCGVVPSEG